MPRNPGTGIYTKPYPDVISATTIESAVHNGEIADIETDLNTPRPIVAGGTGANNATAARTNLSAEVASVQVINYNSQTWESGSFWSAPGATGAPNPTYYFFGVSVVAGANASIVARAIGVPAPSPGYIKERLNGVWGAWKADGAELYVDAAGDTMTGALIVTPKGSQFGTPGGTVYTGAVIPTDANIKLYDQGNGQNWCGMGIDANGVFWLRTGLTGTPVPALAINTSQQMILTGDPVIRKSSPTLTLDKTDTSSTIIFGKKNNSNRWSIILGNATAEGGSNAGSDFYIGRSDDGGSHLSYPLSISRATGNFSLTSSITQQTPGGAVPASTSCAQSIGFAGGGTQYGIVMRPATDGTTAIHFFNAALGTSGAVNVTTTATTYLTTSDERLKEDLKSFDAGNIIDDTTVYDFAWKSTGERAYGVIGQQAIEVYPSAVAYMKKEDWYGVDYSKYVPVILQELKALRARVAALEAAQAPP